MPKLTKNLLLKIITEEAKALEDGLSTQSVQQIQNISKFAAAASSFYAAMDKFNKSLEDMQMQGVKDKLTGFDEMMTAIHDMVKNPGAVPGIDSKPADSGKSKALPKIVLKPSKPTGKVV